MKKNKKIVNLILSKVLKELSDIKVDINKNINLINNENIDSLALVTFFSELDKKFKSKKKLLDNYHKFKDTDQLTKYLEKK